MLKNHFMSKSVATVCMLGMASGVFAVETSLRAAKNTLVAKSTAPVAHGTTEVTFGLDYYRTLGSRSFDNNWGKSLSLDKVRLWDWQAQVAFGIAEDMDMFVTGGWFDIKDRNRARRKQAYLPRVPAFDIKDRNRAGMGDIYGRGLSDMSIGMTKRFLTAADGVTLAYIPELFVPVGRTSKTSGRLGLGRDYWELNNTLAMTVDGDNYVVNANLSHSIPFGNTNKYRGTTGAVIEAVYTAHATIQPMASLSYGHVWISNGNDADLLNASVGSRIQLAEKTQLLVGYEHPVAGRNMLRGRTISGSLVQEF